MPKLGAEPVGFLLITMYIDDEDAATDVMHQRFKFIEEVRAEVACGWEGVHILNQHVYEIGREIKL